MNTLPIAKARDVRHTLKTHTVKKYSYRSLDEIKYLAIHHSLTKTGSAESFARYHVNHNNWPGIGYHFVIEQNGIVKWCHDLTVKSYHVGNSNRIAVGICLTGDFREADQNPRPAQKESLDKLVKFLLQKLKLDSNAILGHSEFPGYSWKQCPCIDMNLLRNSFKKNNHSNNTVHIGNSNKVIYHTNKIVDLNTVQNTMKKNGHVIFSKDHRPYNLNIVGIRSANRESKQFDDSINCFYKFNGTWHVYSFKGTTDPGLYYLNTPLNSRGTAILLPGQYRRSHAIGLHRNKYAALRQIGAMTIARDNNKDNYIDIKASKKYTGIFGINIHRASSYRESVSVNKWSAGCQVIADPESFDTFMKLCRLSAAEWGNKFSYTLLSATN